MPHPKSEGKQLGKKETVSSFEAYQVMTNQRPDKNKEHYEIIWRDKSNY